MSAAGPQNMRPLIVGTGFSRGIGLEIARALAPRVQLVSLQRGSGRPAEGVQVVPWDLSRAPAASDFRALEAALGGRPVWGFLHAAGILGPIGTGRTFESEPGGSSARPAHERCLAYAEEFERAQRVNHLSVVPVIEWLLPRLDAANATDGADATAKALSGARPPFVLHLSSGAAFTAYVGLDAYCTSKAACLMHFRLLAARVGKDPGAPRVLSVAPGTVMTDMMKTLLSSSENVFPGVAKFRELEQGGGLVTPEKPAREITRLLLDAPPAELDPLHGEYFDLRKGVMKVN